MTPSASAATSSIWDARSAWVESVDPEIPGVATYHLRLAEVGAGPPYVCPPGQFNMLYLPGVGEAAISVSGHDTTRGTWQHTIRTAGGVTIALQRLGVGGALAVRGPFGQGWPLEDCLGRDLLMVAGGIGLAPLRPAIEWALSHPELVRTITLVYGARTPSTMLFRREYTNWIARGLRLETTVDRSEPGWSGNIGVVPLLIDRLRPMAAERTILLTCGPEVMMRYAVESGLNRGLRPTQIWLSIERNMQCAIGHCGHCQLGPAFVCKDGPVFRWDRIAPYLDVEGL